MCKIPNRGEFPFLAIGNQALKRNFFRKFPERSNDIQLSYVNLEMPRRAWTLPHFIKTKKAPDPLHTVQGLQHLYLKSY